MSGSSSTGPLFANQLPAVGQAALTTAQTGLTGLTTASSNIVLVYDNSGGSQPMRINDAQVVAAGTLTAAVVNWWLNPSSTTIQGPIAATQLAAVTPSATVASSVTKEPALAGRTIPAGAKLYATLTITENVEVLVDMSAYPST